MARLGADGAAALERLVDDVGIPMVLRLRAALSELRYGTPASSFLAKADALLTNATDSDDPRTLAAGIELCGLIGGSAGREGLRAVATKVKSFSPEQRQWLDRDIFSVQLALEPDAEESVHLALDGRAWKAPTGIVFGSLEPIENFGEFVKLHQEKLERLAESLHRTNIAFGSEPILYVDIIPDDMKNVANEGWTQNSIHLSKSLIEHPRVSAKTTIQGAIHEACERWESKGFVGAEMESDYLHLLGDEYTSSPLDTFRLRHRFDIPSHGGHPWDGTREFMAEAGSILLAEPRARETLLDAKKDRLAGDALDRMDARIKAHAAHVAG